MAEFGRLAVDCQQTATATRGPINQLNSKPSFCISIKYLGLLEYLWHLE